MNGTRFRVEPPASSVTSGRQNRQPVVVVDDQYSDSDVEMPSSQSMEPKSYGTEISSTPSVVPTDATLEYKQQAVAFWKDAVTGRRTIKNVQHRFKRVRNEHMLRRWEKEVEAGGSRSMKLAAIHVFTLDQFHACVREHKEIHDWNLRAFALEAANTVSLKK